MANITIKEALLKTAQATKTYVDAAIQSVDVLSQLESYAKKTEVPTKTSQLTNDSGFITSIPSEYVTDSELTAKGYATTSYVNSQIANITGGTTIPSYVVEEAQMVADKVIEKRNAYSLVISAMSDLHTTGSDTSATGVLHAFQGINEIDKITEVDLITIHGDVMVGHMDDTYKDGFKHVKTCMNEVTKNIPLIHMQGNHDELSTDTTDEARQKYYRYIGANNKHVVTDFNARYGNYGYKDFDDLKIRFIYLNSADCSEAEVTGNNWITKGQFNWFINTALDFSNKEGADDWQWIVGTHHPLNSNGIMTGLCNILKAYTTRTSGTYTYNNIVDGTTNISYNFTSAKQKLICHLHGHIHNFRTDWYDDVLSITVPNACFGRNNEYGTSSSYGDDVHQSLGDPDENGVQRQFNKTINTANDTAFVALVIDSRVNNKIYAYCYGAGIHREIDLVSKKVTYISKEAIDVPDEPSIDNLVRSSINSDGTIFNNVGYQDGKYCSSSGSGVSNSTGFVTTGLMKLPTTFYIKGGQWTNASQCRIQTYKSDFTYIGVAYGNSNNGLTATDLGNGVTKINIDGTVNSAFKGYTYARISLACTDGSQLIITTEEISTS